jgi:hypothetical protein
MPRSKRTPKQELERLEQKRNAYKERLSRLAKSQTTQLERTCRHARWALAEWVASKHPRLVDEAIEHLRRAKREAEAQALEIWKAWLAAKDGNGSPGGKSGPKESDA